MLDPKHPPPQTLLSELKRIGYSSEGLEAMRTLVGTNEREKMILRAGYLKFRIRQSAPNPLHQAEWSNIEPQLIAYGISDEEIEYAAVHRIPQIKGWLFSETG